MTIPISSRGDAPTEASPEELIRAEALSLGFDAVRMTDARLPETVRTRLGQAIAAGHHGEMAWLETRTDERSQPRVLWPDVTSVVMLGMNYGPDEDPMAALARTGRGNISVYARGDDYHDVVKKRLKRLGRWMCERFGTDIKVFVDTAPVAEKPLAERAGLGWQGKHTNLVSREFGSWLFLGAIYTRLPLDPDPPEADHCGSCRACLDVCPTGAFPAPYRLDARRCISYLTIELKKTIPRAYRGAIGNRIYGCDDCLAVCPWNKFAQAGREMAFHHRTELDMPLLSELSTLDDTRFRALFRKSPVKRIGRDRFVRNVTIALGNDRAHPAAGQATLSPLLEDASPQVRAMAVWAWGRLGGDPDRLAVLADREEDAAVRDELVAEGAL